MTVQSPATSYGRAALKALRRPVGAEKTETRWPR